MFTGIYTNEHVALHLKAGKGISMQQLIYYSEKRLFLHPLQWETKKKQEWIWPSAFKSCHHPGPYWYVCMYYSIN